MRFRCVNILAVLFFFLSFSSVAYSGELDDGFAAYERGDFAVAIKKFRKLAEQGNAFAQVSLGVMYAKGEGVPQDYKEAAKWYRKAAEQGLAPGQHGLGFMYYKGNGVPQDFKEAVKWLRKSAE